MATNSRTRILVLTTVALFLALSGCGGNRTRGPVGNAEKLYDMARLSTTASTNPAQSPRMKRGTLNIGNNRHAESTASLEKIPKICGPTKDHSAATSATSTAMVTERSDWGVGLIGFMRTSGCDIRT